MVRIYNILPQDYVDATSVSDFQSLLTPEVRKRCDGILLDGKICFRADHSSFNVVSETHFKSMKKYFSKLDRPAHDPGGSRTRHRVGDFEYITPKLFIAYAPFNREFEVTIV